MYARQNGHSSQYPVGPPAGADAAPPQAGANHGTVPIAGAHAGSLRNYCGTKAGRVYTLKVEQQPIRARMCGFGDKDRRPITPPPCIRLIVTDAATGAEIPYEEIDSTFFVLTVDLWDQDATHEVNLVRHSSGAPTLSISNSTTTSYPPPPERQPMYLVQPTYRDAYGQAVQPPQPPGNPYAGSAPMAASYYSQSPTTPITAGGYPYPPGGANPTGYVIPMATITPAPPATATGMFTRNLIGSLTVNAFRLTDTENKQGFWFVLQDLSVRTEGMFRLKMNFVDVGSGQGTNSLNTGRAPVLATCFSDVFQVYSAKKFPGVIESTPLSKCFASQGIKIPIRKDGPKPLSNQAEYDADDV